MGLEMGVFVFLSIFCLSAFFLFLLLLLLLLEEKGKWRDGFVVGII